MNQKLLVAFAIGISLFSYAAIVDAHIPIAPNDGTTIGTATEITDPWKSWFYYSELDAGVIHYYTFEAAEGERIRFMLNVPIPEGGRGFTPGLVLMGLNITDQGTHPTGLEVPTDVGVLVIAPSPLKAEYEGFSPLSQYTTVDLNMSAPVTGTYYIGVYEEISGGRYALVTGYVEAYDLISWILVPVMAMTIITWTGQSILFLLLLLLLPLTIGLVFLVMRHRSVFKRERIAALFGIMGGLLLLGSSFSFFIQMLISLLQAPYNWTVIVSLVFALLPLVLGSVVLRTVRAENWESKRSTKVTLVVVGLLAPFVWAGFYVGPLLVILAGLVPLVRQ